MKHPVAGPLGLLAAVTLLAVLLVPTCIADVLRVAVISDLNGSYGSSVYSPILARHIAGLVELQPDLIISTGDMVAGQRRHPPLERDAVEAMWSAFHAQVSDPIRAANIPFAVTPGNHDASAYPAFAMERAIYLQQWQERTDGLRFIDRRNYPFNYAFALGDVLFISLDATRVGVIDDEQRSWLDTLLQHKGAEFRHRVAFSHLPIYPFSVGRETEVTADHELERLLQQHQVELYLSGHHHAFYPGFRAGIRHVGQACLGAGPRRLIGTSQVAKRAVTWLEFDDEDGITVNALTGPGLDEPIDFSTLPASIVSRYGTLVREDLRPITRSQSEANETGEIIDRTEKQAGVPVDSPGAAISKASPEKAGKF